MIGKFVMVTTAHKGVFGGILVSQDGDTVRLKEPRMCVYWSRDVRGVVGLAANGPTASCKVTAACLDADIKSVTGVFLCTDDAAEAWRAEPWG